MEYDEKAYLQMKAMFLTMLIAMEPGALATQEMKDAFDNALGDFYEGDYCDEDLKTVH